MESIYEKNDVFTPGEEYRRMRNMYASPSQVLTDMVLKLVGGKYAPNVPTAKLPKYTKTNNRPKSYYDLSELLVSPLYRKTMCRYLQRMDQDVTTSYGSDFLANWEQRSTAESVGSSVDTITPFEPDRQLRVSNHVIGNNGGAPCFTVSDPYVPPLLGRSSTTAFLMTALATGALAPGRVPSAPSASPPQFSRPGQTGTPKKKSKGTQAKPGTASKGTQDGPRAVVSQETQTTARKAEGALSYVNRLKNTTIQQDNDIRELNLLVDDLNDEVSKLEKKLGEADAAAATRCAMLTTELLQMDGHLELANKYYFETMQNVINLEKELQVKRREIHELVDAKNAGVDVAVILKQDLAQAQADLKKAEEALSYLKNTNIQQDNNIRELNSLVDDMNKELYPDTADASTMANIPYQEKREPSTSASLGGRANASTMTDNDENSPKRKKSAANPNDPMDTLEKLTGRVHKLKAHFNNMAVASGNPISDGSASHVPLNTQLNAQARANITAAEFEDMDIDMTNQNTPILSQNPENTPTPATNMDVDEEDDTFRTHEGTRNFANRNLHKWNEQPQK